MTALEEELDRLETLSPAALKTEWIKLYGTAAPGLSADLLRHGIAYRLQEKALGKLSRPAQRALSRTPDLAASPKLKSGTQLLRSWNGKTIAVTVTDEGYHYEGRTWTSLTAIARAVTGAAWSGPRFFGMHARDRA